MDPAAEPLLAGGFDVRLIGFSALDRFCGLRPAPYRFAATSADLVDLAKAFDQLRFPGVDLADAAVEIAEASSAAAGAAPVQAEAATWYWLAGDAPRPIFPVLAFAWDFRRRAYRDDSGLYPIVRYLRDAKRLPEAADPGLPVWFDGTPLDGGADFYRAAGEAALLLSRYRGGAPAGDAPEAASAQPAVRRLALALRGAGRFRRPGTEEQRRLLSLLITSRRPDLGLALLAATGYVSEVWPELAELDEVDHAKEFHPEGNVWSHTLETFRYRKIHDLTLGLGLLLHDAGKPAAEGAGPRRFDQHAEIGDAVAGRFLRRLGFPPALIADVGWLVRHHMLPAALPRLPLTRSRPALESPLFPLLLELYRCDEASSFKGLDGFYDSCAAYRAYLKNVANPYRAPDGKRLLRRILSD
jgi:poly(A) polymerase